MKRLTVILLVLAAGCAWLAWEFGRQLYEAAIHGTISSGRSNNRRVRRATDPAHFRNLVVVTIVLYGVFAGGAAWLFIALVAG